MLRYCTSLLIHIGAVVLGPYFAHIAVCDEGWMAVQQWCPAPYAMAVIYSIICMLLLNVQVSVAMLRPAAAQLWAGAGGATCLFVWPLRLPHPVRRYFWPGILSLFGGQGQVPETDRSSSQKGATLSALCTLISVSCVFFSLCSTKTPPHAGIGRDALRRHRPR